MPDLSISFQLFHKIQIMGLYDRISRLVRANLNDSLNHTQDPVKIIKQAIVETEKNLTELRQKVVIVNATQQKIQNHYDQAQLQATTWYECAQLALDNGSETIAKEALFRKASYTKTAATLKSQLVDQAEQLERFNRILKNLEEQLSQLQSLQERTLATQINVSNSELNQAEDPVKILEQAIIVMQENLVELRQAVATATTKQKWTQQDYTQAVSQVNLWEQRVQLALQKGKKNLAAQALVRQETHAETAAMLKSKLDQRIGQVESLQRELEALESKISEAKTKKNMLKAKAQEAKANKQIQAMLGGIYTSGSAAAFERMEAWLQAEAERTSSSEKEELELLESGSDVDDELAAMRVSFLTGSSRETGTKPPSQVDDDLEQLRQQLNDI
jgi:phage shock protein A